MLTPLFLALVPAFSYGDASYPSPRLNQTSLELKNTATESSYNRSHKQADWVFYELGAKQLQNCTDRTNTFRPDPRLDRGDAAQLADYKGSGFDRGHLSPAGDNKWSQAAMDESFLLSNVSPQPPAFNRGIWARLEALVRAWAKDKGGIFVTTGPLLRDGLTTIGDDKVSVPEYFYKVLTTESDDHDTIAFLLPSDAKGDFSQYEMDVDKLQDLTGIDFLDGLKNEDGVKAHFDATHWDLHSSFTYFPCKAVAPGLMDWAWGLSGQ